MNPRPTPIGFSLAFVEGRAVLSASACELTPWVTLSRLELEVPRVRFPFDVTGGAVRFQRRRTRLRGAALRISPAAASQALAARPRLPQLGVVAVWIAAKDDRVELCGQAKLGERPVPFSARLEVTGTASRIDLLAVDVRTYGFLPLPAPLLPLAIAAACGARPRPASGDPAPDDPGPIVRGCDELRVDPLRTLVAPLLVRGGWRIYDDAEVGLDHLRATSGQIEVSWRAGARDESAHTAFASREQLRRLVPTGEVALADGDIGRALSEYRAAYARSPEHPLVGQRLVQLLAGSQVTLHEAGEIARELLERLGDSTVLLSVRASAEEQAGDSAAAARTWERLAGACRAAGEPEGEACALRAAASAVGELQPERAIALLERLCQSRKHDWAALELLSERYVDTGRPADAARLLVRRVPEAPLGVRAGLFVRLGLAQLRAGDAEAARTSFGASIAIDPRADVWRLLGDAEASLGGTTAALAAYDQAVTRARAAMDRSVEARAHLDAAGVLLVTGDVDRAAQRARQALAGGAQTELVLDAARMLEATGHPDEALAALERIADSAESAETRSRALEEARRLEQTGDVGPPDEAEPPGDLEAAVDEHLAAGRLEEAASLLQGWAASTEERTLRADLLARAAQVVRRTGLQREADLLVLSSCDAETSALLADAAVHADLPALARALSTTLVELPPERRPPERVAAAISAIARHVPGDLAPGVGAALAALEPTDRAAVLSALALGATSDPADDPVRRVLSRLLR